MTSLIIEDSLIDATLITDALTARGFSDFKVFERAEDALDYIRSDAAKPDFCLVDSRLPGMSGTDFIKLVKACQKMTGVPCISLSTSNLKDEIRIALAAGADGYFVKPSDLEEYERVIARIIEAHLSES
ncbi:MAG: response regulator [Oceanicaulis sp.]|jgi:two-component system cell cycle response regulator DivK|uniref:response regulator n=1 Tax=Oceanicaulis TaxID=153232 RepID=UPI0003B7816C|nr:MULTISPECIES: response regulator [Oceanicaulis]MAP48031.1 response regulator [Oceanicaulis sp.]MBL4537920.1 response regulator [Oceanicaulis sp.]VXC70458.1 Response regulator [Oceanicaulis sp. 350]HCR65712.1 response regulator [Oceanicaulis sp.]|tara:strand:+ start:416 stop:802 length:387 start_codon:yes stop_codon:yes gene_type:complete